MLMELCQNEYTLSCHDLNRYINIFYETFKFLLFLTVFVFVFKYYKEMFIKLTYEQSVWKKKKFHFYNFVDNIHGVWVWLNNWQAY